MWKLTMLLSDSAQAIGGKLYILGGGWSITGPDPTPCAIAIKLDVPWDEANRRHKLQLALLSADEQPIIIPTPIGEQKVEVSGEFEVGRPPGIKPGTPIDLAIAFNVGPIPLPPGGRYLWRCSINSKSHPDWEVPFSTRPVEPGPAE